MLTKLLPIPPEVLNRTSPARLPKVIEEVESLYFHTSVNSGDRLLEEVDVTLVNSFLHLNEIP